VPHFSWASGQRDGDHVVIERWPRTKRIYSARCSGAPIQYVDLDQWHRRWGYVTSPCEIIVQERLKDLL
jgi:hypothetical protein